MCGCIRYCVSKSTGRTPCVTKRVNSDSPRSSVSATSESTVGGNWHWSPIRMACWQPLAKGTSAADSAACVHSSIRTVPKRILSKVVPEAPIQVAHTTSAFFKSFQRPSKAYCFTSSLMLSGLPTRTTCKPRLPMPLTKLSTAVLLSAVTSIGSSTRPYCTKADTICTAVVVLPVPGGPWIRVMRRVQAKVSASSWLLFKLAPCRSFDSSWKVSMLCCFCLQPQWSMGCSGNSCFPTFDSVVSLGMRISSLS
mmetsp:Transcript_82876/g.208822  ORF Transcript_82876/g.208822 Transcript_82876/m.208822 type:complete len:252 (-) Transcript_82876:931-1686(-)